MIIETKTSGMPPQQYCLRWNNHRANLLTVFDELLRNESFTDVTLVCEDGVSVKCHKMVLAACSSYFQCLFSELPCRHPVVVLKDIRYADIKAILEYMYRGEVSIAQDQLAPLLKVAEALKVKGLVEENSSSSGGYKSKTPIASSAATADDETNNAAISTSSSLLAGGNGTAVGGAGSGNSTSSSSSDMMLSRSRPQCSSNDENNSRHSHSHPLAALPLPPPPPPTTTTSHHHHNVHHEHQQHHQQQQHQHQQHLQNRHHARITNSPNHHHHLHHHHHHHHEQHHNHGNRFSRDSSPPPPPPNNHHGILSSHRGGSSSPSHSEPEFRSSSHSQENISINSQQHPSSIANIEDFSPPHSTSSLHQTFQKSSVSYVYNNNNNHNSNSNNNNHRRNNNSSGSSGRSRSPSLERSSTSIINRMSSSSLSLPAWPIIATTSSPPSSSFGSAQAGASAGFGAGYDAPTPTNNSSSDVVLPPLKRKKSIFPMINKDTPILRTVLGQGQADSSQPIPLVCHSDDNNQEPMTQSNGPTDYVKNMRSDSITEEAHSPQMDAAFLEEEFGRQERMTKIMHSSSSTSPQSFYSDAKGGVSSAIANYVPTQKPEWKRYKQYTRNDIMSAIDSVRNGMSALQAAKKYGVPSRTLYDKVKKLGISTQRPFRRSSGGIGSHFSYGLTSPGGNGGGMMFTVGSASGGGGSSVTGGDDETASSPGVLEHGFLQHALEMGSKMRLAESMAAEREVIMSSGSAASGSAVTSGSANVVVPPSSHGLLQHALEMSEKIKAEMNENEALSSMSASAAAASASGVGHLGGGDSSSGGAVDDDRSLSPNPIKYEQVDLSPLQADDDDDDDNYEDQVEDLSISSSRKLEPAQARVIMPPMSQATANALLGSCNVETATTRD